MSASRSAICSLSGYALKGNDLGPGVLLRDGSLSLGRRNAGPALLSSSHKPLQENSKRLVLSCARSLFSDKGQSWFPMCSSTGSRSGVSAQSAPGSFVKAAGSVLSGEALATKHNHFEQNVQNFSNHCLADDIPFCETDQVIETYAACT